MMVAIIGIILIPAAITIGLGNNNQGKGHRLIDQHQEESIDKQEEAQEQLIGMVAKAVPITYEEETLKAQVIMARSYIQSTKAQTIQSMSIDEMKQLWGSDYNKNYDKLKMAVQTTKNIILTYNNEPIQPIYHWQSAGITQDPLDVWELEVPYLSSVESKWDTLSPDLIKEKQYSIEEFINTINDYYTTPILEAYNLEAQIQIVERGKGGYVKSIQIGNQLMGGEDFRKLLDLRSSCFAIAYNEGQVKITTKGIGHGVGLSQYGANEMAKEGKDFKAILSHYFPKAQINHES